MRFFIPIFLICVNSLIANIINVNPDGSADYTVIQDAVTNASIGDTIQLADFEYKGEGNYNIHVNKEITICSASKNSENCIINPGDESPDLRVGFMIQPGATLNTLISDLTVKNGAAVGSWPDCHGGGILVEDNASVSVERVTFITCEVRLRGAALAVLHNSNANVKDCIVINCGNGIAEGNAASPVFSIDGSQSSGLLKIEHCLVYSSGTFLEIWGGNVEVSSTTVANMIGYPIGTYLYQYVSQIHDYNSTSLKIYNTIFAHNANQCFLGDNPTPPDMKYSLIYDCDGGNYSNIGDDYYDLASLEGEFGNLETAPLFVNCENNNFQLASNSPCINAGDPNFPCDPDGSISDIGYFVYEDLGIEKENKFKNNDYRLTQNYPNPFNPETQISYDLGNLSYKKAKIVVYNTNAQEVWQSKPLSRNSSSCLFDGRDLNSGMYYYCLVIDGEKINTKSMILLK